MREFVKVMKALSDPNRVKIIKMLQQRTLCVCETRVALALAQPTVSKHFRILENAGLVTRTKQGLWVDYRLSDGSRSPYVATLLGNLKHWLADDEDVRKLLEELPAINREEICKQHQNL